MSKVTKIKQFRIDSGSFERQQAEDFLESIARGDLIEAKTEQKAHTYYETYLTVIYQEEKIG